MRFNHVLNDPHYTLSALDKLATKLPITLPKMILVETIVAVGIGDATDDGVADDNNCESVEDEDVHDGCIRQIRLVNPV